MLTMLSSHEVLGEALTIIASRDPHSVANKTYYAYDYAPTGDEIISTFTKLHGTPPQIVPYTAQDYEKALQEGGMGVTSAGYRHAWGEGDWMWRGERIGSTEQGKDFEELARQFKK